MKMVYMVSRGCLAIRKEAKLPFERFRRLEVEPASLKERLEVEIEFRIFAPTKAKLLPISKNRLVEINRMFKLQTSAKQGRNQQPTTFNQQR
jgi:hypothetical protein